MKYKFWCESPRTRFPTPLNGTRNAPFIHSSFIGLPNENKPCPPQNILADSFKRNTLDHFTAKFPCTPQKENQDLSQPLTDEFQFASTLSCTSLKTFLFPPVQILDHELVSRSFSQTRHSCSEKLQNFPNSLCSFLTLFP